MLVTMPTNSAQSPHEATDTARPAPVRGTLLLFDDDAKLFMLIVTKLTAQSPKPVKTVDVLREAVRCYAEKLNVDLTQQS